MSPEMAWRRPAGACLFWASAAASGAVIAAAPSIRARKGRRIETSSAGRQLDHVEQGFVAGAGENEAPAVRADPLDDPDHVALGVAAVAQRPGLVAEHQGAEEDHPPAIVREDRA